MQSKGTDSSINISINIKAGKLRLVLPRHLFDGEQKFVYLGVEPTEEGYAIAEGRKAQILSDIRFGQLDTTLKRYKIPRNSIIQMNDSKVPRVLPTLDKLWQMYVDSKTREVSPNTMRMYQWVSRSINRLESTSLSDVAGIVQTLNRLYPADSRKRLLIRYGAACKYAMSLGLLDENPFEQAAKQVKLAKSKSGRDSIVPFSKSERDEIIDWFDQRAYELPESLVYANLIEFLFYTGCRPGEAIALQWKHVKEKHVVFTQSVATGEDYSQSIKQGLKTQSARKFPLNDQMKKFLWRIKPEGVKDEAFVFPSPTGKLINWRNFTRRHWSKCLESLDIDYRKPYQTRHTFITLCLESGIDAKDVARWVGNSPEVIYKHYAGNLRNIDVPEL